MSETGSPLEGLVYYPDTEPGIRRRRAGRGFTYVAADGTRIDAPEERRRLESMAVPPAYTDVWMCPIDNGHLLATGFDQRGRKQYRYHPAWSAGRAETKFAQLPSFGTALPRIRRRVRRDLDLDPGERTFALAAAVALLDRLAIRIGNPAYTAENGSFGLVTLRRRHLRLSPEGIRVDFVAKGGKRVRRVVRDRMLNRVLDKCGELPGAHLIGWLDRDGHPHTLSSGHVNDYIAELAGDDAVTAKTFRTWVGTLAAFEAASTNPDASIKAMSEAAADRLANTPTIARNSYIHPAVLEHAQAAADTEASEAPRELTTTERRLLAFLEEFA